MKKNKNIIIIDIATTFQGAHRLLFNRTMKINKISNFENYIMCPKPHKNFDRKNILEINFSRKIGIVSTLLEIRSIYAFFRKISPDLIHTHNSKAGAVGRIAGFLYNLSNKKKTKIIHQVHGFYYNSQKGIKRFVFIYLEFLLCLITDILLFQNVFELKQSKRYKMDRLTQLLYLGNGIDFDEFKPRNKNRIKNSKILNFICVARIENVKNHYMIINALDYLVKEFKFENFVCYFIGEITETRVQEYIKKKSIEKYVKIMGMLTRKEVQKYLSTAYLSFLTSVKEGKPRNIMESMYVGVPCIATNVIGTNELIIDGVTGYLVELNDYKKMALKIKFLCENKKIWESMSKNSHNFAKKNFSEDKIIMKLVELYKDLN